LSQLPGGDTVTTKRFNSDIKDILRLKQMQSSGRPQYLPDNPGDRQNEWALMDIGDIANEKG